MDRITKSTRAEAYAHRPKTCRQLVIMEILGTRQMTAREIADELGYEDLNAVKPRLTELLYKDAIRTCGKKKDYKTGRTVAIYEVGADGKKTN